MNPETATDALTAASFFEGRFAHLTPDELQTCQPLVDRYTARVRAHCEGQVAAAHYLHVEDVTVCVATAHHTGRRIVGTNIGWKPAYPDVQTRELMALVDAELQLRDAERVAASEDVQ